MKLQYLRHSFLLALLLLVAQLSWGQGATTAAMSGTITDSKGQPLPGATIVAVHTPTNTTYGNSTNADGRFNIQNMRVGGPYTVKVSFVGYQDFTRTGINLTLAENFRLDAQLGEASTQLTEVTVTGRQNPIINSDRTGAATTIQRAQIERLPTINRSFNDFTRLTPQGSGTNTQSFAGRNNLYNNLTIDGAIFNNAFGLSSTIGGQASAQPVSLDAIDQIQVSLAPYDVRQGSFTGAGINAVTRSGTNKFSASVYDFYRNQSFVGQKVGDYQAAYPNFHLNNVGFRLGGPIVKDKLFFFVNFEQEKRMDPPSGNYTATRAGVTSGPQTSQANAADLDALSAFLVKQYGYNPGPYENYSLRSNSYKATAKLDWNINNNNHFNIKYNYLKSYADINPSPSGGSIGGSRAETNYGLPFYSSYYTINNNLNSIIAELNSTLGGGKYSNNLTAGYIANRDYREYPAGGSPFPMVDIGNQVGLTPLPGTTSPKSGVVATNGLTTFGSELYSAFNVLNSDIYQFGDNFTAFLGKHNVTVGTYDELYKFSNGYAPNYYGTYQYNSLEDFYASAGFAYDRTNHQVGGAYTGAPVGPARYALQYSTQAGFPFAVTKAAQLGFYVQDEYTPISNLKITLGLRGDIPIIFSSIDRNLAVSGAATDGNGAGPGALTFRDGVQFSTSQLPERKVLFSPRIGFNWDVNDDKKTQVRGGTGIFTGRVPFVWISNQAGNNGVQFNSIDTRNAASAAGAASGAINPLTGKPYTFSPDVNAYRPMAGGGSTSYSLAVTDRTFKFPQVWRSNLAVDQVLPGGIVATIEGLYTKDVNAMYIQNVGLPNASGRAAGPDQRPIFYALGTTPNASGLVTTTQNYRIYTGSTVAKPTVTDAELLTNTSLGYSYSITGQLSKNFSNGLFASVAYTYSDSRSVNDGNSSVAYSNWSNRQVSGDPNANVLSYSQWLTQHRVIASLSYRHEYVSHLATTFSMFYDGEPTGRYSYTYNFDMNGDGVSGNDLMYIPRTQSEINLAPISTNVNGSAVVYSAQQQWTDLNNFINQDPYLSKHRGQYAERNGAVYPWQHRIDVKMIQDIFTNIGENRNALQFSVDVFNIGNLLNRNWGAFPTTYKTNPLNYVGYNAQGQPVFSYAYYANPTASNPTGTTLTDTFRANTGSISSRWQIQLGLRYLFN